MLPSHAPSNHLRTAASSPCPSSVVSTTATSEARRSSGLKTLPSHPEEIGSAIRARAMDLGTHRCGCSAGRRPRRSIIGRADRTTRRSVSCWIEFWPTTGGGGRKHGVRHLPCGYCLSLKFGFRPKADLTSRRRPSGESRDQAGTYVNLITSPPMRSLATRRSRGRGPAKNGWPDPSTMGWM